MFGYPEGTPTKNSHFGTLETSSFAMDNVQCTGSEATILDCPHFTVDNCGTSEGAGVICSGILSKIELNETLKFKKKLLTLQISIDPRFAKIFNVASAPF